MSKNDDLKERARDLRLYGLLKEWESFGTEPWLEPLIQSEESERAHRSLQRRIRNGKIGRFKPMADFDYAWPSKIDREQIEEIFELQWIEDVTNVILVGSNGTGKTMIAQNLAHQAVLHGTTVLFTSASQMLNDLVAQEGGHALRRRLSHYFRPKLLVIDEIGYLSYDDRHADLLFEVLNSRYTKKPVLITTNKAFTEWSEVFPNATCVVTLVDRLVHHAEIVKIDGDSYRRKEAKEQTAKRAKARARRRKIGAKP